MQGFLEEGPFITINSDIITDLEINKVINFHKNNNSKLTLVVRQDISPEQYDSIEICKNGRIAHFIGASSMNIPKKTTRVMFTGIQIMEPDIFERIPEGQFCGTTEDIFPQMIQDGVPIYGYLHEGYWKDMGNRESYIQVNTDALNKIITLKEASTYQSNNPSIIPPALVGPNCRISKDSKIGPHSVIGPNCIVESGAVIESSILWGGVTVGAGTTIKRSVIAQNKTIGGGANIDDQSII